MSAFDKLESWLICSLISDMTTYGNVLLAFYVNGYVNATKHIKHYMEKKGADYEEDVFSLFEENPRIKYKIAVMIYTELSKDKSLRSGEFVGTTTDTAPIMQSDYDSKDWLFSNGNIDKVKWTLLEPSFNKDGTNMVSISIEDPYKWTPNEARPSQCIHKAMEALKTKGAADYMTKGTKEIILPKVNRIAYKSFLDE